MAFELGRVYATHRLGSFWWASGSWAGPALRSSAFCKPIPSAWRSGRRSSDRLKFCGSAAGILINYFFFDQFTAPLVHGDAALHAAAVVGLVVVPVLVVDGGAVLPGEGGVVRVLVESNPVGEAVLGQLGQQELVLGYVVDGGQVAALVEMDR